MCAHQMDSSAELGQMNPKKAGEPKGHDLEECSDVPCGPTAPLCAVYTHHPDDVCCAQ